MSVGNADIAQAINAVWDASTLDSLFMALWSDPTETEFSVLHDVGPIEKAGGAQPFPFCVFEMSPPLIRSTSVGDTNHVRRIMDVPINFRVHVRDIESDSRTAKEIAAYLAEEIMKVFGGHPTQAPTALTLINGNHLLTLYQNDYSVPESDEHCQWIVSYLIRADVPEAVTV